MKSKKQVSLLVIFGMLIFVVVANLYQFSKEKARIHQHLAYPEIEEEEEKSGFSTHLPIVILDTKGRVITSGEGEEAYSAVMLSVIDNEKKNNNLTDKPVLQTSAKIKYRGNSSLHYDKKQYAIKLMTAEGDENNQPIMGMAKEHDWVLNGSFIDKSMIRNYMCLNIAGEIMDYAPNVRFCEVFLREGTKDTYQGVYVMSEKIKRDKNRINLLAYDKGNAAASYLIRRDRYNENEIMLNNYATKEKIIPEYLGVKYPPAAEITKETIAYIEEEITLFEKDLIASAKTGDFNYEEYIDVDSFVDYFIINEFFANYDSGLHSAYTYKEMGGKFHMGPVWDFDGALDNYNKGALESDFMVMPEYTWYPYLLKDKNFVDKIVRRYIQLRKTVLSEPYILRYIEDTVSYLGEAKGREFERWGYFYEEEYLTVTRDGLGRIQDRNVKTYGEEIERIKKIIEEHGTWMDENIESLYDYCGVYDKGIEVYSWLAVLFVTIFLIAVILVQRN